MREEQLKEIFEIFERNQSFKFSNFVTPSVLLLSSHTFCNGKQKVGPTMNFNSYVFYDCGNRNVRRPVPAPADKARLWAAQATGGSGYGRLRLRAAQAPDGSG